MSRAQSVNDLVRHLERARELASEISEVRGRIVGVTQHRADPEHVRERDFVLELLMRAAAWGRQSRVG